MEIKVITATQFKHKQIEFGLFLFLGILALIAGTILALQQFPPAIFFLFLVGSVLMCGRGAVVSDGISQISSKDQLHLSLYLERFPNLIPQVEQMFTNKGFVALDEYNSIEQYVLSKKMFDKIVPSATNVLMEKTSC